MAKVGFGHTRRVMSREAAQRILSAPYAVRFSLAVAAIGWLNVVVAASLDTWSFLVPVGHAYEGAFVPSFVLAFPVYGWAVALFLAHASIEELPKFNWRRQFSAVPVAARRVLQVIGLAALIAIIPSLSAIAAGQPHFDSTTGAYTQNSHGLVTVVSRATYEHALAGQLRLFLGGAILFSAVGVAAALNHLIERAWGAPSVSSTDSGRPDAIPDRDRIGPRKTWWKRSVMLGLAGIGLGGVGLGFRAGTRNHAGIAQTALISGFALAGLALFLIVVVIVRLRRQGAAVRGRSMLILTAALAGYFTTLWVCIVGGAALARVAEGSTPNLAIPGFPGYYTSTAREGHVLKVGAPWGTWCMPVEVFADPSVDQAEFQVTADAVALARSRGINIVMADRGGAYDPHAFRFPPRARHSVAVLLITADVIADPPINAEGKPSRYALLWSGAPVVGARSDLLAHVQITLYPAALRDDPVNTAKVINRGIAAANGVFKSTSTVTAIAARLETSAQFFSNQDIAAMLGNSGCAAAS